jgi:hypothetical protein
MPESKFEKYVVRKPGVITAVSNNSVTIEVPKTDKIPWMNAVDTGPLVIFSNNFVKDATSKVEYGFITGDTIVGNGKKGQGLGAHKHEYVELFMFLGTNPQDTQYLGAEVEFWLGEGRDTEKIIMQTSSCVYVAPGVAHFPLVFRNVKSPVMMMVIVPDTSEHAFVSVEREEYAEL